MYCKLSLIITLVYSTMVFGQIPFGQIPRAKPPVPKNTAEYQLNRVKELHEGLYKEVTNRLAIVTTQMKDKRVRKDKKKYQQIKREKIRLEKIAKFMKEGKAPYLVTLDVEKLKPGQIGCFKSGTLEKFKVANVLGPDKAIVYPILSRMHLSITGHGSSQSFYSVSGSDILLTKYPTTGLTSDADISLVDLFKVTGTKNTPSGTVIVLEAYSMKAMKTYLTTLKKNKK